MRISLTKTEKVELLKAIQGGVLNTERIERIVTEIKGINEFLEAMQSLPELEPLPVCDECLKCKHYLQECQRVKKENAKKSG